MSTAIPFSIYNNSKHYPSRSQLKSIQWPSTMEEVSTPCMVSIFFLHHQLSTAYILLDFKPSHHFQDSECHNNSRCSQHSRQPMPQPNSLPTQYSQAFKVIKAMANHNQLHLLSYPQDSHQTSISSITKEDSGYRLDMTMLSRESIARSTSSRPATLHRGR